MAAADLTEFSATSLCNLPGNKISPLEYTRPSPRKTELQANDPSKRSIRMAPGTTEHKRISTRLEPLPTAPYIQNITSSGSNDLGLDLSQHVKRPVAEESKCLHSDRSRDEESDDENPFRTPRHMFSVHRERLLLDNLIQYDEDETDKQLQYHTDDELYRRWRDGDNTGRKTTVDNKSNRQNSSKPPVPSTTKQPHGRNGKDTLCGWQTDSAPAKRERHWARSERKNRASSMYQSNGRSNSSNNQPQESTFKFFHYTDTALYIQQYRNMYKNTSSEEAPHNSGLYSQYFDKSCLRFDTRDFPVKLDLASTHDLIPVRHKYSTNHVIVRKDDPPPPTSPPQKKPAAITEVSPLPNCVSPAALHPRFSTPKPPSPSMKLETTYRCHNPAKLTWQQAARKTPDSQASMSSHSNSSHSGTSPATLRRQQTETIHKGQFTSNVDHNHHGMMGRKNVTSATGESHSRSETTSLPYMRTPGRPVRSAGARSLTRDGDEEQEIDVPYQTSHTSFSSSRIRPITFEDNALRERCDARKQYFVTLNNDERTKDRTPSSEGLPDKRVSPDLSERKIRLNALIAAEIRHLQQRKAMTSEQKRKLDNFRRALSNSTYHSGNTSPIPTPRLSGSIRAFYTRTADAKAANGRKTSQQEGASRHHNSRKMESAEDNQPIIYVTQPKLRKQAQTKPHEKQESRGGRRIIGGVLNGQNSDKNDFRQFTRITDLLSAKRRQNKPPSISSSNKSTNQRKKSRHYTIH